MEGNFNRHLGSKLRMRRLALGLTQTKVANAINVTFQQIQKYEKGTNGISSLRLMQLANFLKIPVLYFFEDYPGYLSLSVDSDKAESVDLNYSFLARLFSNLSSQQKEKTERTENVQSMKVELFVVPLWSQHTLLFFHD